MTMAFIIGASVATQEQALRQRIDALGWQLHLAELFDKTDLATDIKAERHEAAQELENLLRSQL